VTPKRAAEFVRRWASFYTRDLPGPLAERRVDEIDADLHDHTAHERAVGISDRRIALGILSRMTRGAAADILWRHQFKPRKGASMRSVVLGVAVVAFAIVLVVLGEADDAPGLVMFGFLLILAAAAFGARPALRTPSRALGLVLAAIVLTVMGSGLAGWLENNF